MLWAYPRRGSYLPIIRVVPEQAFHSAGWLKDRARPAARVLNPAPPCCRVLRCALHGPLAPVPPLLSPVAWLPGLGGAERLLLFPLPAAAGGAGGSDPV